MFKSLVHASIAIAGTLNQTFVHITKPWVGCSPEPPPHQRNAIDDRSLCRWIFSWPSDPTPMHMFLCLARASIAIAGTLDQTFVHVIKSLVGRAYAALSRMALGLP